MFLFSFCLSLKVPSDSIIFDVGRMNIPENYDYDVDVCQLTGES